MANDSFPIVFSLLCGGFFFLVFGGLGIWLIASSRKQRQKLERSQNWPTTIAEIILAEVRERSQYDNEGDTRRYYYPHVEYRYQVAGVTYQGDALTLGARVGYPSPARARQELARYPVGAQVRAYFNPEDPKEAVLELRTTGSNFMLIFGILALLIGLCSLCGVLGSLISNLGSR
ncbi:MAG: DUF3592 domain-containing protein [Anaerolineales bacterium]|nr:DUF3592 domain-containing protein [Anaerolineales bacterium]MDW8446382.1 DUF3592 domain-containing protein [Anaerolineales bacterium]